MRVLKGKGNGGPCVALGAGLASFFVYLELLKAMRSSQWSGFLPSDWVGIALGGLFYTAALGLLLWVLMKVSRPLGAGVAGLALAVGGMALWGVLSIHREVSPTLDDVIVGGAMVGFGGALQVGLQTGRYSPGRCGLALALVWFSGLAALYGAGQYFLFTPQRAMEVTLYPVFWIAPVGVILLGMLLFRARLAYLVSAGVVGVVTPLVAVHVMLYAPPRGDSESRPSMVFLVSDTLRADYASAYGGPVPTPRIAGLAEKGVLFDRHYALAPWTLPSMTGLFSSTYPKSLTPDAGHERWTLEMNMYAVDYTAPTLPQRLEAAGYRTGAFTANAFMPSIPGMMLGYQDRASSHPILLEDRGYFNQLPFLSAALRAWCPVLVDIRPHNTTHDLDHYARAFIQRHRDKPFFLWIHYIDPHAPYDPPESMRRVEEGPWPFFHPYVGGERWGIPILGQDFAVEPVDQDYVQSLYEGEVAYIDGFVGRIQDALTSAGIADDTYFCMTSDHGEELWDHGGWGHGQSLYDELMRVPLIITGPDVKPATVAAPVSAIDVVPTLAALMGVTPSDAWQGKSLVPVLRGEGEVSMETPVFALGTSNKATSNPEQMVVLGDYKLIRVAGGESRLYHLAADPKEEVDVSAEHPEMVAQMSQLLDEWVAGFSPYFDEVPDQDMVLNLEGMGYL